MQFDNYLDYLENLYVILSLFDGSRIMPKCNGKCWRPTEKNEGAAKESAPPLLES